MNTIIQIWNLFFNYVFSDNGFLVAFGFAALGILTAITIALLFLIPIMLLRSFLHGYHYISRIASANIIKTGRGWQ